MVYAANLLNNYCLYAIVKIYPHDLLVKLENLALSQRENRLCTKPIFNFKNIFFV